MPNWCMTSVCFKGKPDNINRLINDIKESDDFQKQNGCYWCNIRHLLHNVDFDTVSYFERYPNRYLAPSFRGSCYNSYSPVEKCDDGDLKFYALFEMAWDMDYHVLQIISKIYGVEFSAYSEECGMDIHHKCKNGSVDYYDYDYSIKPHYDQYEELLEECPELDQYIQYDNPVKSGSKDEKQLLNKLKENNIEYESCDIPPVEVPDIYGVYYHYIYGVIYEDEVSEKFYRYPGIDPFNIYNK